jgi:dimethylamine monooxygenase subunit A
VSGLLELFPDGDYGFRLTLKRGVVAEFLAPTPDAAKIRIERARWLEESPERYVFDAGDCAGAWREVADLAGEFESGARELGVKLEPDLVVLMRDSTGVFRLRSGVVVFPTGWGLEEKIGQTLSESHGIVPGLNPAIGAAIDRFLDRLRVGGAATRSNWGLAATSELNLHPLLPRPRLTDGLRADEIWLRVEHQMLAALPGSGAILFGIRIALHRLDDVGADADVRSRLHRALGTMPPAMAAYKGLAAAMPTLLRLTV